KKYVADTFDTGVTAILPLKELGLLASIGDLPVQKENDSWVLNPIFDPPDSTMVRVRVEYQTAVINTKLVRPEDEPQSFLDFLNPKWKGKKLVTAPPRISWPLVYLHVMLPDTLNEDYFRALGKQDMLIVGTMRDEASSLARGEAYAAVSTSVPIANSLIVSGAPLKPLTMREGTISSFPVVSVPKNAPHPNAARVFVNWWISPEGQTTINKAMGVPSIRKDVPDFSYQGAGLKPVKFLALDEVALRTVAKYVTEGRVDKFLGVDVK
ncbi:MAG: extracellular solute-binding protein, partial [Dehalococcoidia bacterium]|nr:extracellular solute-binding protein [Dehalococcoidia bacterium]